MMRAGCGAFRRGSRRRSGIFSGLWLVWRFARIFCFSVSSWGFEFLIMDWGHD